MAAPLQCPPEFEKLLKDGDVKLTVADGARMVTEDEMNAIMREGDYVQGKPEFISNNGRVESADKWAQTTPDKLGGTPDAVKAGDQRFYLLSYTIPGTAIGEQARCDKLALKISGAFDDVESGRRHMKALHKAQPQFALTLEHLYQWTAVSDKTISGDETRKDALAKCMQWYHEGQQKYRHDQLDRMQAVKEAAAKGEVGPIHEDYKDIDTQISYGDLDPESDDPRLLEDRPSELGNEQECQELDSASDEDEQTDNGRAVLRMKPDPIVVGGLEWFVLTCVVPEEEDPKRIAFKISGAFRTAEEADDQAGLIMDTNPFFSSKVVKLYNWIELPVSDEVEKKIKHRSKDKTHEEIMGEYFGTERSQKHAQIVETIELVKAKEAEERAARLKAEQQAKPEHLPLSSIAIE